MFKSALFFINRSVLFISTSAIVLLGGCEKTDTNTQTSAPPPVNDTPIDPAATASTVAAWQQGTAILQACIADNETLREAIRQFLAAPAEETLTQSKQAWQQAHGNVLAFSVFFQLAENNPGLFGELDNYHYNLDAQPVQPGFIDYFDVYQFSGIVNDIAITLSAEALRHQHGITDTSDVSIGFHAMEYLLWGESGERPVTDFVALNEITNEQTQQGLRIVDLPNNRRRVYLQLLAELMVDDCSRLAQVWQDPSQTLVSNYQTLPTQTRIQLWQAAVSDVVTGLKFALTPVTLTATETTESKPAHTATDPTSDTETAATETSTTETTTEEFILHTPYARREALVFAGQLRGLVLLLYGEQFDSEATSAETLAAWINPNPSKPAPLIAIKPDLVSLITQLRTVTTWPLPTSEAESLEALLNTVQSAVQPTVIRDPQDAPETPPSP